MILEQFIDLLEHSGPRGGKSQKFDVLKSAYTKVSLKVDKISDTMQKKSAQKLILSKFYNHPNIAN